MGSISLLESAQLLLDLGQDPNQIWPDLIEGRRTKLSSEISKSVTTFNGQNRHIRTESAELNENLSVEGVSNDGRSALLAILHENFVVEFFTFLENFNTMFINSSSRKSFVLDIPAIRKSIAKMVSDLFKVLLRVLNILSFRNILLQQVVHFEVLLRPRYPTREKNLLMDFYLIYSSFIKI